jgi:predicted ester cyclase
MADNKDLVRRFYKEVFENHNLAAVDDLLTEGSIDHQAPPPGLTVKPGRDGVKEIIRVYLDAFNPLTVQILDQYEDGDTVITRAQFTGTHSGGFAGIPATGKVSTVEGIDITRFEGDRAAEHWGQFDVVGMLTQLGVIPPMG